MIPPLNYGDSLCWAGFTACPVFHLSVCRADWTFRLPFEIYIDQDAFIPLTPGR
jgi:hypothetical protein